MSIKENVLLLLEENKNKPLSGEEIADILGCTRAGIWKAVKALQSEGYEISAVNNKGYTLTSSPDVLSEAYIKDKIKEAGINISVSTKNVVDSTNNVLKNLASSGTYQDMVLIAEEQTAGKGRRGRSFYSPSGTGIYISFLLHPDVPVYEAPTLTTMAATAAALAIEKVSSIKADIKWVNDIFVRNKKVSGILTEASTSIEDGSLEYAIVGIGINLYEPEDGFPEEIKNIAGSVFDDNIKRENLRNNIASELIIQFMNYYYIDDTHKKISTAYIDEYKSRSIAIGKHITIMTPDHNPVEGNHSSGIVLDIDDNCHLLIEYDDGVKEYLSNGEISINLS